MFTVDAFHLVTQVTNINIVPSLLLIEYQER